MKTWVVSLCLVSGGLAQEVSFELEQLGLGHNVATQLGDFNADGLPDVMVRRSTPSDEFAIAFGTPSGRVSTPVTVTSTTPAAWGVGDINGDGRDDFVSIAISTPEVRVQLAESSGTLGPPIISTMSHNGRTVSVVDIDGDGHDDVLVAHYGTNRVSLLTESTPGTGALVTETQFITGPEVVAVDAGDLTGDGHVDVVALRDRGGLEPELIVFHQLSGGGFASATVVDRDSWIVSIDVVDLNGDGAADIGALLDVDPPVVAAFPEFFTHYVYDENGDYLQRQFFGGGATLTCWAAGDADGDDITDVLLQGVDGGTLWRGEVDGSFTASTRFARVEQAHDMYALDFDQDGALDLLQVGFSDGLIFNGRGDGRFGPIALVPEFAVMDIGDMNHDGFDDCFITAGCEVFVLLGKVDGVFDKPRSVSTDLCTRSAFLADVDEDGDLDGVTLQTLPAGGIQIATFLGDGTGGFSHVVTSAFPLASALRPVQGDANGDGHVDVIAVTPSGLTATAAVLLGLGDGTFIESSLITGGPGGVREVVFADVTGDGAGDLVCAGFGAFDSVVFAGDGAGGLAPPSVASGVNAWGDLCLLDVDGDDDLDLVLGDALVPLLVVQLNAGDGTFGPRSTVLSTVNVVKDVVAGDLDADGIVDLLCVGHPPADEGSVSEAQITVIRGLGSGNFAPPTTQRITTSIEQVLLSEVNGDGFIDAMAVTYRGVANLIRADGPWESLGYSLAGSAGFSDLEGRGSLDAATPIHLDVSAATPGAPTALVVGSDALLAPFKGGVLVPTPTLLLSGFTTSPTGTLEILGAMPVGVSAGFSFVMQAWIQDAGAPLGWSATRGLSATAP